MVRSLALAITLLGAILALAGAAVLLGAPTGAGLVAAGVCVAALGALGIDTDTTS